MAMRLVQEVDSFAETVQQRSLGVLPWCRLPSGEVRLVLGRESCLLSQRHCPFEGSAKPGETTYAGAAREYVEESLGVMRFSHGDDGARYMDADAVEAALECGAASRAVCLRFRLRQRSQAPWKEAVTVLAEVAYDPDLERHFQALRGQLIELMRFGTSLQRLRQRVEHAESLYGRQVSVAGRDVRVVDVLEMRDFAHVPGGLVRVSACVRCADADAPVYATLDVTLPYSTAVLSVIHHAYLGALRRLVESGAIDHPAVRLLRDEHDELAGVRVNVDFLEKDLVRMWSRDELRSVMAQRGHYSGAIFRSSSCALLEVILDNWDAWF